MKRTLNLNFLIASFAAIGLLTSCGGEKKTEEKPKQNTYETTQTVAPLCDSSWFPHTQTPPPEEGKGSPFDVTSTTNKIFHQWSWQKFLWLTKPTESGKTLFEEQLTQVDALMDVVNPIDDVSLVLDATQQAGSNAILLSNPTTNPDLKSDTVYYSIHVNDIFQKAAASALEFIQKDTANLNNDLVFPVGALELKVSWIKASAIPVDQQSSYYITEGYISSTQEKTKVAFLGMHVVGVVENHPEFIWATFEHKTMAPKYDWSKSTASKDAIVNSDTNLLFYEKGYEGSGSDITWTSSSSGPYNVFTVYEYGVPKNNGGSYMTTSQQEPINYDNIVSINECVAGQLDDVWNNYFYNGSVWIDTDSLSPQIQADTIVALGGNLADANEGSIARGSLAAFNITMETFVQTDTTAVHTMNVNSLTSCISCHNAAPFKLQVGESSFYKNKRSPMYISHLFRGYLHSKSGVSEEHIEKLKIEDFKNFLNKKRN